MQNVQRMAGICMLHILNKCEVLLLRGSYTEKHNWIYLVTYFRICRKFDTQVSIVNHWEHQPNNIEGNNSSNTL